MRKFEPGDVLEIEGVRCVVHGYIVYRTSNSFAYTWIEYKLGTPRGVEWLSIDDKYGEYSLSSASYLKNGVVSSKWHKVDEGVEIVVKSVGDVDVEPGDSASFTEYEDSSEEETLSIEVWEDGTEVSEGEYLDADEIRFVSNSNSNYSYNSDYSTGKKKSGFLGKFFILSLIAAILFFIAGIADSGFDFGFGSSKIKNYVSSNYKYEYLTSITGSDNEKADIYLYKYPGSNLVESVVKDILGGIEGDTEYVEQSNDDGSVTILTKKEFCIVYTPEEKDVDGDGQDDAIVQVSGRKYVYSSNSKPYHASSSTHSWYRNSYYNRGYRTDSRRYSNIPSAFDNYDAPSQRTYRGNSYFNSYARNIRQSSIRSRQSDSGGISSGK